MTSQRLELLRKAKRGSEASFGELMVLLTPPLYRVVFGILPNHHDAEDICQEAWIRFWNRLLFVDSKRDPMPYVTRIAVNLTYKALKKGARMDPVDLEDLQLGTPEGEDPSLAASHRATLAGIYSKAETLPPQQRVVFLLCEIEGYDSSEAGKLLKLKPVTVRRHLSLARQAMKKDD